VLSLTAASNLLRTPVKYLPEVFPATPDLMEN
jgi:hypothetical protein